MFSNLSALDGNLKYFFFLIVFLVSSCKRSNGMEKEREKNHFLCAFIYFIVIMFKRVVFSLIHTQQFILYIFLGRIESHINHFYDLLRIFLMGFYFRVEINLSKCDSHQYFLFRFAVYKFLFLFLNETKWIFFEI